jgi:hypothetical protein
VIERIENVVEKFKVCRVPPPLVRSRVNVDKQFPPFSAINIYVERRNAAQGIGSEHVPQLPLAGDVQVGHDDGYELLDGVDRYFVRCDAWCAEHEHCKHVPEAKEDDKNLQYVFFEITAQT